MTLKTMARWRRRRGGGDEDRKAARLRAELTVAYCPPCEPMAMRMQGDVRVGIGITIEDLD